MGSFRQDFPIGRNPGFWIDLFRRIADVFGDGRSQFWRASTILFFLCSREESIL